MRILNIINLYQFRSKKDYWQSKFPQFTEKWSSATINNIVGLRMDIIRFFGSEKPNREIVALIARSCRKIEYYLETNGLLSPFEEDTAYTVYTPWKPVAAIWMKDADERCRFT